MIATEPRKRIRPCVRCGTAPRHGETYLCPECHVSPAMRGEIDAAKAADPDHPRFALIQAGWRGGW